MTKSICQSEFSAHYPRIRRSHRIFTFTNWENSMRRFFFPLFVAASALMLNSAGAEESNPVPVERYLEGRLTKDDKRYPTLLFALQLMKHRKPVNIVETGTSRFGSSNFVGDGGFTLLVGDYVRDNGGFFYSVDTDFNALSNAATGLGESRHFVRLVNEDSVLFLQRFKEPIDFLYLDSFDFDVNDPIPAQQHHLKEIMAAYPNLTSQSVVMIDDCGLPYWGKGKFVVNYLVSRGWKILANGYQVILAPDESKAVIFPPE